MAAQTLYVIFYGQIFPSCTLQCDIVDQTSSDQVEIEKAMEEQMNHQDVKSEEPYVCYYTGRIIIWPENLIRSHHNFLSIIIPLSHA